MLNESGCSDLWREIKAQIDTVCVGVPWTHVRVSHMWSPRSYGMLLEESKEFWNVTGLPGGVMETCPTSCQRRAPAVRCRCCSGLAHISPQITAAHILHVPTFLGSQRKVLR